MKKIFLFLSFSWILHIEGQFFENIPSTALCIARCPDDQCGNECNENVNSTTSIPLLNEMPKSNISLQCKDVNRLVLKHNLGIYIIESKNNVTDVWTVPIISKDNFYEFSNLEPGSLYQFRVRKITLLGITLPEITEWFQTNEENYIPEQVKSISIDRIEVSPQKPEYMQTYLNIIPADDLNCLYNIIHWGEEHNLYQYQLDAIYEYRLKLKYLKYNRSNTIYVMSRNEIGSRQSQNVTLTFVTPPCLDVHNDLNICAPPPVKGLQISSFHSSENLLDFNVSWIKPALQPNNYTIIVQPINCENCSAEISIPGNQNTICVPKVILSHQYKIGVIVESEGGTNLQWKIYTRIDEFSVSSQVIIAISTLTSFVIFLAMSYIFCRYNNIKRRASQYSFFKEIRYIINRMQNKKQLLILYCKIETIKIRTDVNVFLIDGSRDTNYLFLTLFAICSEARIKIIKVWPLLELLKFCCLKNINRKNYSFDDVKSPLKSLIAYDIEESKPRDKYEIQIDRLSIQQILGSGISGIVKLATFQVDKKKIINVAVKMLREDASSDDVRNFHREILLMKSAGNHQNIVSLIGCCTLGKTPLLIVEYCSKGDLQTYLRKILKEILTIFRQIKWPITSGVSTFFQQKKNNCISAVNNCLYDIQQKGTIECLLTPEDLLNFAQQIASGMEYLSSNRIVHRDLAARNVLVCADRIVKISDFGLSRDIYQENVYKKQSDGKLPLKWMAIEALTHQIYTTHSDVWSFGVLLYEIVTLGGNPYPGVESNQILQILKSGYRMDRPSNCGFQLYGIMCSCWHENPLSRPSFNQLKQQLHALLSAIKQNEYLNLNQFSQEPTQNECLAKYKQNAQNILTVPNIAHVLKL